MSKIQVNDIVNHFDDGAPNFPKGIVVGSGATLGFNVGTGASIYSPSDNVLTLGTNNAERLRIAADGTTTVGPTYDQFKINAGSGSYDGEATTVTVDGRTNSGDITAFKVNRYFSGTTASTKFLVNYSGAVGVGTDVLASSSKLTLYEESGNGQTLEIKAKNTGGAGSQPGIKFTAPNGDNIGGVYGDVNSDALKIQTGGTDRVVVSYAGTSNFTSGSSDVCAKFTGNGVYVNHVLGSEIFFGTQSGSDGKIGTTNNSNLHLFANGYGNRITVNTSGSLSLPDGDLIVANGHGINFGSTTPDGTTPTSELLDDYEEGTWTPAFNAAFTIVNGYTIQTGFYTKIGNMVYAYGRVTVPAGHISSTNSSTLAITGLPFTVKNHNNHYPTGRGYGNLPNNNSQNSYVIGFTNQTNAYFYKNSASGYGAISGNDFGSSNQVDYLFSITYRV